MESAQKYVLDFIRQNDPYRYPAVLFLKTEYRKAAAAICAFGAEIDRVPFQISEPIPGEIRFQWWREVISGERGGEATANPIASELLNAIRQHDLPTEGFDRYLDAKLFDLYNDPMPDRTMLETYLGETEAFLQLMVSRVCGVGEGKALADSCGHFGVSYGVARILSRLHVTHAKKQVFVPGDMLTAAGLSVEEWLTNSSSKHETAIELLCDFAMKHLSDARLAIAQLAKPDQQGFLTICLVKPAINATTRRNYRLFERTPLLSPLSIQAAYWKSALIGI